MMHFASLEQERRVTDKLRRELGTPVLELLGKDDVTEVAVNGDGAVWVTSFGGDHAGDPTDIILPFENRMAFLGTIASMSDKTLHKSEPRIEGQLPWDGARVTGVIPPQAVEGPLFNIRKKPLKIYSLDEYIEAGRMTIKDKEFICEAIQNKSNILIAGPTGSGKTTFTNAVLKELYTMSPTERIVTMEDTPELQISHRNRVRMITPNAQITLKELIKIAMRQSPSRIIIGEVRDGVALDLLKSWNTGHPGGVTTLHANSSLDSLLRLEMLIAERMETPMQRLIAQSVSLVLYIERLAKTGPTLTEILEVLNFDNIKGEYVVKWVKGQATTSIPA